MQQLSWKNFPAKIEKSLCKLYSPKCAPNPVHNSVTIYSAKALSVFLCVKGASPPLRRVTFFCCQKKVTKENHLDLRSKDPLARGETFLAGNFPTRPRRFFRFFLGQKDCASTASRVALSRAAGWCHGRGLCSTGFGDYQIAPKPPFGRLWVVYGSLAFPKGKTQQPR